MASIVEEMGVDIEGDRDARMSEDPADLRDVKPEIDDEVAGEGVPEIVEPQFWPVAFVEIGTVGGSPETTTRDVSVSMWGAACGRKDPIASLRVGTPKLVLGEHPGELREQRDFAN